MDNQIDPKVVIKKTADLLMAAGEVIEEIRKREEDEGGSYEGRDLLERVQVAQVLVLVASGEEAIKSRERSENIISKAREQLGGIQKRVQEAVSSQTQTPRVVAMPAPPLPPLSPKLQAMSQEGLVMSVYKKEKVFKVKTYVNGDFQETECTDYFSFSQALVRAMKLLHGEESGEGK